MRAHTRRKFFKVLCIAAQGVLLTVCAVSFAVLSSWGGEADDSAADVVEEQSAVPEEPLPQALQSEVVEVEDGTPVDADPPTSAPATIQIYKADLRGSLDARVEQLARHTSLWRDDTVHYEDLLSGATTWDVPYVLVRFDELAAIYFEALKVAAPKTQEGKLLSVKAESDDEGVCLELTVGFEVTHKLLRLMLGDKQQTLTARVTVQRQADGFALRSLEVKGGKQYADATVRLASDFLFGTDDYMAFVGDVAARVTASLGSIYEVSSTRYGVVFATVR